MKKFTLTFFLMLFAWTIHAQYDTLTIEQVQMVPQPQLAACDDVSPFHEDTVVVFGTVVMDASLAQAVGGRNIWIQSGGGPWSGVDIYTINVPVPVGGQDILG